MFVLSTQRSYNFAWYMVNQVTIDRGAGSPECNRLNNCWASGNGGEIDFLESPFAASAGTVDTYRRLYLNNVNQFGRSFPSQQFAEPDNGHANGGWGASWETSAMMLGTDPQNPTDQPYVYIAVVDKIGAWVYKVPGSQISSFWPGLTLTTAAADLDGAPAQHPEDSQPCHDDTKSCTMFIPNCQGNSWGGPASFGNPNGAMNQGCGGVNGNQGFCQNWFPLLSDTEQWQWTELGTWSTSATDNLYVGVQGPQGTNTCPDGKKGDATWCIEQPWNRFMSPFLCATPYAADCQRGP